MNKPWSDSQLLALPPVVIEAGITDENGVTRGRHLRNPFAGTDDALARRWGDLWWNKPDSETAGPDPFDILRSTIAAMDGQNLFFAPVECNGLAVHPLESNAVASWESACIEMHRNQQPVTVPNKPAPSSRIAGRTVTTYGSDESAVPRFEDSEESKRLRDEAKRKLERGD